MQHFLYFFPLPQGQGSFLAVDMLAGFNSLIANIMTAFSLLVSSARHAVDEARMPL